jgi:hAT family C-terminal dimerisation region
MFHLSVSDLNISLYCRQENQLRYPTIFALAMDILPIQGSAVPCERVFSSSKETTTARRNRLGPELMEALQMLKFSFKKGRELDFTAGTGRKEELKQLTASTVSMPGDMSDFIDSLRGRA